MLTCLLSGSTIECNVSISEVAVGSCCLAHDTDDLWYRATVVDVLDDCRYHVMFDLTHREAKLDANDIFPLDGTSFLVLLVFICCVSFFFHITRIFINSFIHYYTHVLI